MKIQVEAKKDLNAKANLKRLRECEINREEETKKEEERRKEEKKMKKMRKENAGLVLPPSLRIDPGLGYKKKIKDQSKLKFLLNSSSKSSSSTESKLQGFLKLI